MSNTIPLSFAFKESDWVIYDCSCKLKRSAKNDTLSGYISLDVVDIVKNMFEETICAGEKERGESVSQHTDLYCGGPQSGALLLKCTLLAFHLICFKLYKGWDRPDSQWTRCLEWIQEMWVELEIQNTTAESSKVLQTFTVILMPLIRFPWLLFLACFCRHFPSCTTVC